jgi:IclR family KDG regulon transcriptional repressor
VSEVLLLDLPAPSAAADDDGKAGSVLKALTLLDVFRGHGRTLGVSEVSRQTGLAKSTAFRLLSHLEQAGFVERDGTGYRLGWRLFELGNGVQHCQPHGLRDIASPYLGELHSRTQFAVHLAVLDGNDVLYLDKVSGHASPRTATAVGSRVPATCTALGKAILAFNDPDTIRRVIESGLVQRTRYSVTQPGRLVQQLRKAHSEALAHECEESMLGLMCAAAPVLRDGRAVAAVSVSGPTGRFDAAAVGISVRRAAGRISRDLAARDDAA